MHSNNGWLVLIAVYMLVGNYLSEAIKCYSCFSQYEQGRVSGIPCMKPAENDVKILECQLNDSYCMNFMVSKGPNVTLSRGCSHGWCSHSADWSGPHIQCCQTSLCNSNVPNVEPELLPTEEPAMQAVEVTGTPSALQVALQASEGQGAVAQGGYQEAPAGQRPIPMF